MSAVHDVWCSTRLTLPESRERRSGALDALRSVQIRPSAGSALRAGCMSGIDDGRRETVYARNSLRGVVGADARLAV